MSLLHVTVHGMCPYFQRKIDSIIVMKFRIVTYYLNCHIYKQKEMEHWIKLVKTWESCWNMSLKSGMVCFKVISRLWSFFSDIYFFVIWVAGTGKTAGAQQKSRGTCP